MAVYKRVVLKLSGETLMSTDNKGCFEPVRVNAAAAVLAKLSQMGVETAVVIGGGNIWRGRFSDDMNPVNADQMGMLATIINALCVQDALLRMGVRATVFTAQEMNRFARLYTVSEVERRLSAGEIALLAGGSGHPFFTTDTAAALRAAELRADALLKGTTVDGVYDSDPRTNKDAKLIPDITYKEAIARDLNVMDITAFTLCMKQRVPAIRVFSMDELDNILRVADGEAIGTLIHN